MAGRSTLALKAAELGLELDGEVLGRVLDELKRLEHEGYHFEVADGSLELLLRRATGWEPDFFQVESYRVITDHATGGQGTGLATGAATTGAMVKVHVGEDRMVATAEGNGPVNALDAARQGDQPVLSGAGRCASDGLSGAGARYGPRHRGGHPGPRRHHRRRSGVDHDRRVREHYRRVMAGSLRLDRVRLARSRRRPMRGDPPEGPDTSGAAVPPRPMTHPSFVPITEADQVRPARQLSVPGAWTTSRPAELRIPLRPGSGLGTPGPDQGYALRLAGRLGDTLRLSEGERGEDALVVCALFGARRAALFGRAPEHLRRSVRRGPLRPSGDPTPELAARRGQAFRSAAHDYDVQRALRRPAVPDVTLRLRVVDVEGDQVDWRSLLGLDPRPGSDQADDPVGARGSEAGRPVATERPDLGSKGSHRPRGGPGRAPPAP